MVKTEGLRILYRDVRVFARDAPANASRRLRACAAMLHRQAAVEKPRSASDSSLDGSGSKTAMAPGTCTY